MIKSEVTGLHFPSAKEWISAVKSLLCGKTGLYRHIIFKLHC